MTRGKQTGQIYSADNWWGINLKESFYETLINQQEEEAGEGERMRMCGYEQTIRKKDRNGQRCSRSLVITEGQMETLWSYHVYARQISND